MNKECPADKEFNPKTNRCVKKCKDGFVRREEDFKCISATRPKGARSTNAAKPSILSLNPAAATVDTPNPILTTIQNSLAPGNSKPIKGKDKKFVALTNNFVYNRNGNFTRESYEAITMVYLRDILSILQNKPRGRRFIYGFSNRRTIIDEILRLQEEHRKQDPPSVVPQEQEQGQQQGQQNTDVDLHDDTFDDTQYVNSILNTHKEEEEVDVQFIELQKIGEYRNLTQISNKIPNFIISKENEDINNENEIGVKPANFETKEYNEFLKRKEKMEYEDNTYFDDLYPTLDDPNFSSKIAYKQEFQETKYNGEIKDIEKEADKYCNVGFELSPNQLFVKNFLSPQTPYNGLLLYHGVGTGKTCSAIGITEEVRKYNQQSANTQRIIIVASPNVQKNFALQLFDESRLELKGGYWNLQTCVGSSLIKEINPTNMKDVPREVIVRQINNVIHNHYIFLGYTEFARFIHKSITVKDDSLSNKDRKFKEISKIREIFDNRMIVIDEAHNIRISEDNKKKRIGSSLLNIAKYSRNMKLLLLTATPMYNAHDEILWIVNVLNANDQRSTVSYDDVFDKTGKFIEANDDKEGGRELLMRKLNGYISHVRGENPYAFPFRLYPEVFAPEKLAKTYPTKQFNGIAIEKPLQHIPLYSHTMHETQAEIYHNIVNNLKDANKINSENMQSFGYTILQKPLEATIITYPGKKQVGKEGFAEVMDFKSTNKPLPKKYDFKYKPNIIQNHGRVFQTNVLRKYSIKIASICDTIRKSKGVILVYSQFIESGIIPMALALEEMGFSRYSSNERISSLFEEAPTPVIDSKEMVPKSEMVKPSHYKPARYCIITGDPQLSHNNAQDIQFINRPENKHGEEVKVYLISRAASEGLDFKNIRQVHIIDPWYNMNRTEQIIGRAVRNRSHCGLPFKERNVEIYLHSCTDGEMETPDMYLYRLAENKALQIGGITRILKEMSVDCQLNIQQTNFTVEKLQTLVENRDVKIELTNGEQVVFNIGDKPFTEICDYQDNCEFKCFNKDGFNSSTTEKSTYNTVFARMNYSEILRNVKDIFREHHTLKQSDLLNLINNKREFPRSQVFYVLSQIIDNKNDILIDKYNRNGTLINKGNYYAFQPVEINDENINTFERSVPIDFKHDSIRFEGPLVTEKNAKKTSKPVKKYEDILKNISEKLDTYDKTIPNNKLDSSSDWYAYASATLTQQLLGKHHPQISKNHQKTYIIHHYLDELDIESKFIIIQYVFTTIIETPTIIDKAIKSYFEKNMVSHKNKIAIVVRHHAKKKSHYLYILEKNNTVVEAQPLDYENFTPLLLEHFGIHENQFYPEIGFMSYMKENVVFKMKTMQSNHSGARCSQAKKQDIMSRLHCIMNGEQCKPAFNDSLGKYEYKYSNDDIKQINKHSLCFIVEIVLRHLDDIRHRNKRYFVTLEEGLFNQIEKL